MNIAALFYRYIDIVNNDDSSNLIPYLNQKDGVYTPSVWNVIIDHVDLD